LVLELTLSAEAIDHQRQEYIGEIITLLHDLLVHLRDNNDNGNADYEPFRSIGCSFECSSMLLGALTKEMSSNGLLFPRLTFPLLGRP
jgi:hypothetical protein